MEIVMKKVLMEKLKPLQKKFWLNNWESIRHAFAG